MVYTLTLSSYLADNASYLTLLAKIDCEAGVFRLNDRNNNLNIVVYPTQNYNHAKQKNIRAIYNCSSNIIIG